MSAEVHEFTTEAQARYFASKSMLQTDVTTVTVERVATKWVVRIGVFTPLDVNSL